MTTVILAVCFGLFLSYANGANDNFKGVATLYGSGTASYRGALSWASVAQILGSVTALVLAQGLLATFSGKGLVPDSVVAMKSFALSVGLAAALTVMLATRFGFPISTTHALTGALVGAGLLASDAGVNFSKLGSSFFLSLLLSPIVAVAAGSLAYLAFKSLSDASGIKKETCLCVGTEVVGVVPAGVSRDQAIAMFQAQGVPGISVGTQAACVERYSGDVLGISARGALDAAHYLSGGVVCFARALNDTPKIAATLLIGGAFSPTLAIVGVAAAMVLGGLVNSRKVAETMGHKISAMNPEQGFSANLVTGLLVIAASKFGLPVSTTHVSVGSLFGIGIVSRQAKWKTILQILLAWVTTLPLAALLGAGLFLLLRATL